MARREYCYGIYMFIDKKTDQVVYIGMDSHIDVKERINTHFRPSAYNAQQINRVVQNNPDRYEPKIYCHVDSYEEMAQIEFDLINLFRPKFNYNHGGQGRPINHEFIYTVVKNGVHDGKQNYTIKDMKHKEIVQSVDYDYLVDICVKLNNEEMTPEDVKKLERKIVPSFSTNLKRSKNNSTGFYRVRKSFDKTCRQGFLWRYEYYGENGKHKHIQRVDLFKLKKEVERRGLIWHIVDIDKAIATVRSFVAI